MLKFLKDIKNRYFIRFWWAQLISQFGDRVNQMALIGLAYEVGGARVSAVNLAKLLTFTIIPVFIVGPVAGVYVDRWDRQRTLFVCDVARGLLVLTIPFIFMARGSMIPIYAVIFLIFCFSRFYVPAKMSIIPDLVPERHLLLANSLITTTGMIAFVLGCALGGFLVDVLGARGGFIADAITFFASGLLIISISRKWRLRLNKKRLLETSKEILSIEKSVLAEIKEGLRYLKNHKEIRFVINTLFILLSAAGAIYVVIIVFIQNAFQSVTKDLGVLAVFLGGGLFLGALFYGRYGKKMPWHRIIFLCLILSGVFIVFFTLIVKGFPNMVLAAFLVFALGLSTGPIFIAANTIVHKFADEAMRGKVFSALEIVIHFAFLVSMLASSWLAQFIAPFAILTAVGIVFAFVGLVGIVRYKNAKGLAF